MAAPNYDGHSGKVAFIWSIAELLRGDYKRYEYGKVILPLVVLRRLDCVLADTKQAVLDADASLPERLENREPALKAAAGQSFYNLSELDFPRPAFRSSGARCGAECGV